MRSGDGFSMTAVIGLLNADDLLWPEEIAERRDATPAGSGGGGSGGGDLARLESTLQVRVISSQHAVNLFWEFQVFR